MSLPGGHMTAHKIYVLNGPNLNMLGIREPAIYGPETLDDVARMLEARAKEFSDRQGLQIAIDLRQSNHEGHLIDWLHEAHFEGAKAVILNAGGYTHTSIAILDAIKSIAVPVIEVHISDPAAREPFRHLSYVAMGAVRTIQGLGTAGYVQALEEAVQL